MVRNGFLPSQASTCSAVTATGVAPAREQFIVPSLFIPDEQPEQRAHFTKGVPAYILRCLSIAIAGLGPGLNCITTSFLVIL